MDPLLPAVQAALMALWTAALDVPVYDDDPNSGGLDFQYVLVGDDRDPDSESASTFEHEWADLACTTKYERGSIPCVAVASSGDTVTDAVRTAAFALVSACETALRANRTLSGLVMIARLSSGAAVVSQDGGAVADVRFEITYLAQV